jgi:hypothetical protein
MTRSGKGLAKPTRSRTCRVGLRPEPETHSLKLVLLTQVPAVKVQVPVWVGTPVALV